MSQAVSRSVSQTSPGPPSAPIILALTGQDGDVAARPELFGEIPLVIAAVVDAQVDPVGLVGRALAAPRGRVELFVSGVVALVSRD